MRPTARTWVLHILLLLVTLATATIAGGALRLSELTAFDLFPHTEHAEVVAVSGHPDLAGPELRRLSWSLEDREVDLVVAPGIFESVRVLDQRARRGGRGGAEPRLRRHPRRAPLSRSPRAASEVPG